jgi:hypothetical protein
VNEVTGTEGKKKLKAKVKSEDKSEVKNKSKIIKIREHSEVTKGKS